MISIVNVPIKLSERIEALETSVTLERRQVLDRCANKAIFERLEELQLVT
jgi:hypothetical protein